MVVLFDVIFMLTTLVGWYKVLKAARHEGFKGIGDILLIQGILTCSLFIFIDVNVKTRTRMACYIFDLEDQIFVVSISLLCDPVYIV